MIKAIFMKAIKDIKNMKFQEEEIYYVRILKFIKFKINLIKKENDYGILI